MLCSREPFSTLPGIYILMLKDVSLAHPLYVVLNVGQLADLRLQHAVRVRGVQGDVDGGNVVLLVHSITTLVESPERDIINQNIV